MPIPLTPLDPQSPNNALLTTMNTAPRDREQDYGYLSYQRHVVIGLDEVDRLVRTVPDELGTRGLTTPSSSQASPSTSPHPTSGDLSKLSFERALPIPR